MILLEREKLLSELEQTIGYSFRSRALLDRALTHRSFANERLAENYQHNEALEFLGDAVLGLVVSAWLLEQYPDVSEGKLSKMKAYLVSESSLVELAEAIDLGRYILLNRGEEKTGGRRKRALLADAYEALIGVLYIESGLTAAERFVKRELKSKLDSIDPGAMIGADYKSALQERLQAAGISVPEYVVVEALGPDHRRTFHVELRIGGRAVALGAGRTIKLAQQEAARAALADPAGLGRLYGSEGDREHRQWIQSASSAELSGLDGRHEPTAAALGISIKANRDDETAVPGLGEDGQGAEASDLAFSEPGLEDDDLDSESAANQTEDPDQSEDKSLATVKFDTKEF